MSFYWGDKILVLVLRAVGPLIVDCPQLFIQCVYSNLYNLLINFHVKQWKTGGLSDRHS